MGNGVADDKALYPYVPKLIEYYLNEQPIIPNVETFDLQEPDALDYVMHNLGDLVVKPVAASGGYGITIGPRASKSELKLVAKEISQNPRNWIAQPLIALSTCPTILEDGTIASRHIDLRPFAVNDGHDVWVLPGGLTRVALVEGNVVVNSSQGGGSKDTWVLTSNESDLKSYPEQATDTLIDPLDHEVVPATVGPDVLPLTRMQQQEEQQQQNGASDA